MNGQRGPLYGRPWGECQHEKAIWQGSGPFGTGNPLLNARCRACQARASGAQEEKPQARVALKGLAHFHA